MAINKTVNKSTKSHAAMRNCIEYVLKDTKVAEGYCYMTGPSPDVITWDSVYKSFLDEKDLWKKDSGRMYAHNIISFHKDENITAEQVLEFGKEFAEEWFKGYQTLVVVHQDKEHLHIHFVTNTVSYLDGYKLHTSKADMERMKSFTNDMCKERGLTIAQKGKHFDGSSLDEGEVIAWDNNTYRLLIDETKKPFLVDCVLAFINVIKVAFDKDSFIDGMKKLGWNVVWSDKRKHITFVDEQGNKVRDTNLSKKFNVKISKEDILNECKRQNAGVGLSEEYGQLNRELEREVRGGKGNSREISEREKGIKERLTSARDKVQGHVEEKESRDKKSQNRDR